MPSEEKERSRGLYWVIGVAVIGPLLYFLSFGPVSVLWVRMQWSPGPFETFYAPLYWLGEHTPLAGPLEWYNGLWWPRK
jgi:hypothetical protein